MTDTGAGPSEPKGKKEKDSYTYNGKKLTPQEYYEKLKESKRKKQAAWWQYFNVLLVNSVVKIQCYCGKEFSATNPSTVAPKHINECHSSTASQPPRTPPPPSTPVDGPEPTEDDGSSRAKRLRSEDGSSIRSFVASAGQIATFLKHLALFFFKNNIALHLIEHADLVKACAAIGIKLWSRKVLSGRILDEVHAEVQAKMDSEYAKDGGLAALATDGWKNRLAFMGSPLINVMKLLSFRSVFAKVVNASGHVKCAQWICDLHINLVSQLFKKADDCIGFIMDNVKANRAAMRLLHTHNPRWLTVGCIAHGLSLLYKDFANWTKCVWTAKAIDSALLISNTINNSERLRSAVHTEQEAKHGRSSAITVNAPTRFASAHFVVKDLLFNKDVLRSVVMRDDWPEISQNIDKADTVRNTILCIDKYKDTWINFERFVELMQPVSDAIHQTEADRPMLSQIFNVLVQLSAHFKAFDEKYPEYAVYDKKDKTKVLKSTNLIWQARYNSTLDQPAVVLAYVFDPINFVQANDTDWVLPTSQLTREQREVVKKLAAEVYAGNGEGNTAEQKERDKCAKLAAASSEWGQLLLEGVPDELSDFLPTLTVRKEVEYTVGKATHKKVEIAGLNLRLKFWSLHMASKYPAMAYVANRVLRMHATTCASERNWSLWGNLFQKSRNRLAQERAEKLIYIRQNDSSMGAKSALSDEEVVMQLLAGQDEQE